jgi:hypothetical protein
MVITPTQLKKIIDSDEALKIDRKKMFEIKNDHQKKEFAKDVSAIANTPGPRGFLLYGITNDKKVEGISSSDFKEEQMQQIISSRCDPPVKFLAYTLKHLGQDIGILEIPTSIARPHQYLPDGYFFIRRGTITDKMSINEISSAIIRRKRIERYAHGKYDSYSSSYRVSQMKKDIIDVYKEFGYEYSGYTKSYMNTTADRVEDSETKTRFHISVYGDTITYYDLELYDFLLGDVYRNFRVRKNLRPWLNIFLIASYEPIAMTIIKKHHQSMFQTSVKLDGSTIYHGLGDFERQDRQDLKDIRVRKSLLPEFFVLRIRSREDIRTRLAVIFDFIEEKKDVFKTIRVLQPLLAD